MRHAIGHVTGEEEYFHRLDAERIDDMRRHADPRVERRRQIGQACQVNDPQIVATLEGLGYHATTVQLLCVVPLLQVAWADGSLSHAERETILAIATAHGVKANTPAYYQLLVWFDHPPSPEFFEGTLRVIEAILQTLPEQERAVRKDDLMQCCADVACASSGLLGKTCAAKRQLLDEIGRRLETQS